MLQIKKRRSYCQELYPLSNSPDQETGPTPSAHEHCFVWVLFFVLRQHWAEKKWVTVSTLDIQLSWIANRSLAKIWNKQNIIGNLIEVAVWKAHLWDKANMDVTEILSFCLKLKLSECFHKWHSFNVSDGATQLEMEKKTQVIFHVTQTNRKSLNKLS